MMLKDKTYQPNQNKEFNQHSKDIKQGSANNTRLVQTWDSVTKWHLNTSWFWDFSLWLWPWSHKMCPNWTKCFQSLRKTLARSTGIWEKGARGSSSLYTMFRRWRSTTRYNKSLELAEGEFLIIKCWVRREFGLRLTAKLLWSELGLSLEVGVPKNLPV